MTKNKHNDDAGITVYIDINEMYIECYSCQTMSCWKTRNYISKCGSITIIKSRIDDYCMLKKEYNIT